jgi:protein-disulfide isomerase
MSIKPFSARWQSYLDSFAALAMILASIAMISVALHRPKASVANVVSEPFVPSGTISISDAISIGEDQAPLAIIEFSEFQCPFCASFWKATLPPLKQAYVQTGKVRFVFRHFPLEDLHSLAFNAAVAAECAHRQGKFWAVHDSLFANPDNLSVGVLQTRALAAGVNLSPFQRCVGGEAASNIRRDQELGRQLQVSGTPAFFIGRIVDRNQVKVLRRIDGAQPFATFAGILDRLLDNPAGTK